MFIFSFRQIYFVLFPDKIWMGMFYVEGYGNASLNGKAF